MPDEFDRQDDDIKPEDMPLEPTEYVDAADDVPFDLPTYVSTEEDGDSDDVPFHLPSTSEELNALREVDPSHERPTMPVPREPGVPDPRKTLPGTGGLDPNPDFPRHSADYTIRHEPVHQETQPHYHQSQQTIPSPAQYQRPLVAPPPPALPKTMALPQPQRLPRRKPQPRRILGCTPGCFMVIAGLVATFCGGLTLLTLVMTATLGTRLEQQLAARVESLDEYEQFQSTFLYDRTGQQLYEVFGEGRRVQVDLENIPENLINATLAIEDDNFWTNPGIDVPATTRAFLQYVNLAEGDTGGSTITQQVVRNILFDFEYRAERSIQRKVEEILLALILTQRKPKEEILELYLNEIYYGNLAYGAEAAAQTFFGKHVNELTLGEAALLAGLPQAPADLDPLNPDPVVQAQVEQRWRTVLDRMVTVGYITDAERDEALRQGYTLSSPDVPFRAPHFTVYAQSELEDLLPYLGYTPDDIASGGLQVYTTVDLRVNDLALQAARDQVARLAANNVSNAAVVVLQPITGEILAMVGSIDYNNEAIDGRVNVTIALRQPGSAMKPFMYAAAMELGMTPGDVIWDTRTTIGIPGQPGYTPRNYDNTFHGPMIMRTALANSYNIPAVQTLRHRVGVENLLAIMERFGVHSLADDPSLYGLSLTLGGGEVSLLELTNAYAVFANEGVLVPSTSILCILDNDDNIIYQIDPYSCPRGAQTERTVNRADLWAREDWLEDRQFQALDPRIAFIISDILSDNAARTPAMGANSPLNTGGLATSVKTGTTTDVKDNWTVGFTRNVAVGVWVGNNNGDPMVNSSGLTGAAPIWNAVITGIHNNQDLLSSFTIDGQLLPDQPSPGAGVSLREICDVRTLRDPATDCNRIQEWFLDGPAGIPDGNGSLYFPPPPAPPQSFGTLTEISPGVYQVLVQPIPPDVAAQIVFTTQPGAPNPPPPLYCQVPSDLTGSAPNARNQLFIAPPPDPADAVAAEEYARQAGLAFLPTIACSPELLTIQSAGPQVTTAVITSPQPGAVLTGETPIMGTVQFTPDIAAYYKLEVRGGQFPDWVTIGTTHTEPVINGQLENLFVPGLGPGNYTLRLVLVTSGGTFVQPPYEVPFTVP
jgi:penicillin-binding protein 1C